MLVASELVRARERGRLLPIDTLGWRGVERFFSGHAWSQTMSTGGLLACETETAAGDRD